MFKYGVDIMFFSNTISTIIGTNLITVYLILKSETPLAENKFLTNIFQRRSDKKMLEALESNKYISKAKQSLHFHAQIIQNCYNYCNLEKEIYYYKKTIIFYTANL